MNRRSAVVTILFALALIAGVLPAAAQVQRGSILVKAMDPDGGVLPGVTVTITSPILPGAIVGQTDSGGTYRSPTLAVGTYTVKLTLQGFQTFNRENVVVTQNQTVSLDLNMKIGAMKDEVTVTAESPIVDTKSTSVAVNIDKKILETTPGGKDIWSLLEYKAPGVVFDTPDVGGNQAGLQRSLTSRGTPNAQNTQLLNGVNVNDPAAQGFSMNYYVPTTFENIQVQTGSQDITVGTAGVVINMVSKSGSNRYMFQELETCQGHCGFFSTQSHNVDSTLFNEGIRSNANAIDYITNSNVQSGGPILRNKLFYFGSFNYQPTHVNVVGFPALGPSYLPSPLAGTSQEDTTDILAGEGKLTYQLNSKNRFEGYLSKQRYDKPNRGSSNANTQDSDLKELDTFVIAQASWNLVLNDKSFLDTRVSYNNTHFPLFQKTDLQSLLDNTTNIRYLNQPTTQLMFRRRLEVVSNWQYFVPNFLGGRHEFKAGVDNGYTPEDVTQDRVGDVNLTFTSSNGAAQRVTLFNSPINLKRAVNTTALYAQDSYSLKRLTVIGGIRWERVEGFLPAQSHDPNSQFFAPGTTFNSQTFTYTLPNGQATSVTGPYTVPQNFDPVTNDPLWYNSAGRFSATYDLTGRGKTVAKVSVGKYLDQIGTGTPPNPNGTISQQYAWNDLNGDYQFQPGTLTWNGTGYVGAPGSELGSLVTTNITNPFGPLTFNKSLKRPTRNELTVGIDHELIPNLLISTTFIHRREHNNQGTIDQNPDLWSTEYTQVTLTDPGRDGKLGTADDQVLQAFSLNPNTTITSVTVNDDRLAVHYNGVEITMTKRYSKGWTALIGYDYGHTRQDLIALNNPNNVFVNAGGISGGRRHQFNGSASYTLPWYGILIGTEFRFQSGLPITRTLVPTLCAVATLTPVNCTNQQVTLNAETRGSFELPWLNSADLRIGKVFHINRNTLDVSIDLYNITNANTVFAVNTNSATTQVHPGADPTQPLVTIPIFLQPTGVLGPRVIRFNMTYSFGQ